MEDRAEEEVLADVVDEVELVAVVLLVDLVMDLELSADLDVQVGDVEMEEKMMTKSDQNSYMNVDIKSEMETGFSTQTTRIIPFSKPTFLPITLCSCTTGFVEFLSETLKGLRRIHTFRSVVYVVN